MAFNNLLETSILFALIIQIFQADNRSFDQFAVIVINQIIAGHNSGIIRWVAVSDQIRMFCCVIGFAKCIVQQCERRLHSPVVRKIISANGSGF